MFLSSMLDCLQTNNVMNKSCIIRMFAKYSLQRDADTTSNTFTFCSSPCRLFFLDVVSSLCASVALASRPLLTYLLLRGFQLNSVLRLLD